MQPAPLWRGWLFTEIKSAHVSSWPKAYTVLSTGFLRCYQEEQSTFPFGSRQMFEIDLNESVISVNVADRLFSVEKMGATTRVFRVKTETPSIEDWQQAMNMHIYTAKNMPDTERYWIEAALARGEAPAGNNNNNNHNNNPNAFVAAGQICLSYGTLPPPELTTAAIEAVRAEVHEWVGTLDTVIESIVFITGQRVLNLTVRWEAPELGDLVSVGIIAVQSVSFASTNAELRPAMAELLVRANYGLRIGSFLLDPFDGGVIFRSELPLPRADQDAHSFVDLTHMMKALVVANIKTHERYCPALQAVINGEKTPEDAIAAVEHKIGIRAKTDEELRILHQTFIQLLDERDITYELKAQTIIGYSRHEDNNLYVTFAVDESSIVYIKSYVIATSPSYARSALGELAMRATKLTTIGEYKFDYSDGQLLYQTELPFLGVDPIDFRTLLEPLLDENLRVQHRFLPAFQAVIRKGRSALDALNLVPGLSRLDIIGGEAYFQEVAAIAAGDRGAPVVAVHPPSAPALAVAPPERAMQRAANHPQPSGAIVRLDPSLLTDCQRELGTGGTGTVYLCRYDGVEVAVKQLNSDASAELLKEMAIQARRQHKNLVGMKGAVHCSINKNGDDGSYTITHDEKSVLMVMEYCPGGSLRDWLKQLQRDPDCFFELDVLTFVLDIAEGMAALHNDGIVHRDLKPENIFLEADFRRAKIGDFGLAKQLRKRELPLSGAHTLNYTVADGAGTFFYMAPECFLKGEITRATDIFAFGIILHNIFVEPDLRKIYNQDEIINEFDHAFQVVHHNLRPAIHEPVEYQVSGPVLRDVSALMKRCWDSEPSKRPNFTAIAEKLSMTIAQLKRRAKYGGDGNDGVLRSPGKAVTAPLPYPPLQQAVAAPVAVIASAATPHGVRYLANTTIIELDPKLLTNCRERLGSGGMGEVYLCEYDGTPVAVKQLKDGTAAEILQEMSVQSKKSHKNLVRVLGALHGGISDIKGSFEIIRNDNGLENHILMVMEYCPGGSLRGWLNRLSKMTAIEAEQFFTERKVVKFVLDVAEGMAELHKASENNEGVIVHRDLKPENIFFCPNDTEKYGDFHAKIGDFGLAKQLRRKDVIPANGGTDTASSLAYTVIDGKGSRFYMAPECYSCSEYTRKADVFAFGVLLHNIFVEPNLNKTYDQEKILGSSLYPDEFEIAFQYKLKNEQLRPEIRQPSNYRVSPLVHEKMASLMERCWNHYPKQRPDFVQIVQELQTFLSVLESNSDENNNVLKAVDSPQPVARPLHTSNVALNVANFHNLVPIHQDLTLQETALKGEFRHHPVMLRQVLHDPRCYSLFAAWSVVQATCLSDQFVEVKGFIRARIVQQGDNVEIVADDQQLILVSSGDCDQDCCSLAAYLSKIKNKTLLFDERQLLDIAVDLVAALLYLHNLNIAFGALKSQNVFLVLTEENQGNNSLMAKIDDFTHAMQVPSSFQEPSGEGPQADDVFAFGSLLSSMFLINDEDNYQRLIGFNRQPDLSHLSPMLGKVILDLINDCLSEDPRERPSMPEIATKLHALRNKVRERRRGMSEAQTTNHSAPSRLSTGSDAQVVSGSTLNVSEKATSGNTSFSSHVIIDSEDKKPSPGDLSPIEIVRLSPNRQQTGTSVISEATPDSAFFLRGDRSLQTAQSVIIPQSSRPFQLLSVLEKIRDELEVPAELTMDEAIAKVAGELGVVFEEKISVRQKVEHLQNEMGCDLNDLKVLPVFYGRKVNLIKLVNVVNAVLNLDNKLPKVEGMQKAAEILGIGADCLELKTAKQKAERVACELGILVDEELSPFSRSDSILDG